LHKLQRSSGSNTASSWLKFSPWNSVDSKPVFLERHDFTKLAPGKTYIQAESQSSFDG